MAISYGNQTTEIGQISYNGRRVGSFFEKLPLRIERFVCLAQQLSGDRTARQQARIAHRQTHQTKTPNSSDNEGTAWWCRFERNAANASSPGCFGEGSFPQVVAKLPA